jgi:hypothetical protein
MMQFGLVGYQDGVSLVRKEGGGLARLIIESLLGG